MIWIKNWGKQPHDELSHISFCKCCVGKAFSLKCKDMLFRSAFLFLFQELITVEYYVKTICTKTYFFVQQQYLVTVMISSMIHFNKRKKITRCFKVRWNWYTQIHRLDSYFNRFFLTFITQVLAEVSYLVVCISCFFFSSRRRHTR